LLGIGGFLLMQSVLFEYRPFQKKLEIILPLRSCRYYDKVTGGI